MDAAWVGVVGGAIGASATFAATVYTQWRAENERNQERAHEEKRWSMEWAAEDARWARDKRHEDQQRRQEQWGDDRRQVYKEAIKVIQAWQRHLIRSAAFFQTTGIVATGDLQNLEFQSQLQALASEVDVIAARPETAGALWEADHALYCLQTSLLHGPHPSEEVEGLVRQIGDREAGAPAMEALMEALAEKSERGAVEEDVIARRAEAARKVARFLLLARAEIGLGSGASV